MAITLDGTKGITTSAGLYAQNAFTGTYADGIVADYTTGLGRISVGSADGLAFYNGGVATTELMRLDTSGNLGLGVTPSAWATGTMKAFQVIGAAFAGDTGATYRARVLSNAIYDGSYKYLQNNYATLYTQDAANGQHQFYTAQSGTAGNPISFTQAMTLQANGQLGIGTTAIGRRLSLGVNTVNADGITVTNSSNGSYFTLDAAGATGFSVGGWANSTVFEAVPASTGGLVFSAYSGNMIFQTGGRNERMRIDSSGNLLVGTTSSTAYVTASDNTSGNAYYIAAGIGSTVGLASTAKNDYALQLNRQGNTDGGIVSFKRNGAQVGYISVTASATTYATSSDYRLKENIQPMQNALEFVRKQRPVTYNWKADGSKGSGYIAHWMQEDGAGNCVTGEKDAVDKDGNPVYQGIDTSFMVAPLNAAIIELADLVDTQTKLIQELKAELDELKAKVK